MLEVGSAAVGTDAAESTIHHGSDIERQRRLHEVRAAVDAERRACRRIVEDRLRLMLVERRTDAVLLVRAILADMDARGTGARDTGAAHASGPTHGRR